MKFTTTLRLGGKTATGIRVPDEVVDFLGSGKRIAVTVEINAHRYRSTVATMLGEPMIPVSAEVRSAAGIAAGHEIAVDVERDFAPRTVDLPDDLEHALQNAPALSALFAALSYSNQKRHVVAVTSARGADTRARRVQRVLDELQQDR